MPAGLTIQAGRLDFVYRTRVERRRPSRHRPGATRVEAPCAEVTLHRTDCHADTDLVVRLVSEPAVSSAARAETTMVSWSLCRVSSAHVIKDVGAPAASSQNLHSHRAVFRLPPVVSLLRDVLLPAQLHRG